MVTEGTKSQARIGLLSHRLWNKVPVGLFLGAGVVEMIGRVSKQGVWFKATQVTLAIALVFSVLAAILGVRAWNGLPRGHHARNVALGHASLMGAVVLTFFLVWVLRFDQPREPQMIDTALLYFAEVLLIFGVSQGFRVDSVLTAGSRGRAPSRRIGASASR